MVSGYGHTPLLFCVNGVYLLKGFSQKAMYRVMYSMQQIVIVCVCESLPKHFSFHVCVFMYVGVFYFHHACILKVGLL